MAFSLDLFPTSSCNLTNTFFQIYFLLHNSVLHVQLANVSGKIHIPRFWLLFLSLLRSLSYHLLPSFCPFSSIINQSEGGLQRPIFTVYKKIIPYLGSENGVIDSQNSSTTVHFEKLLWSSTDWSNYLILSSSLIPVSAWYSLLLKLYPEVLVCLIKI